MIIIAEHKVLGSTVNDRADGILSVTNKVSERGAILMSDFFASEDYASMLFFLYLDPLSYGIPSAFGAWDALDVKASTIRQTM